MIVGGTAGSLLGAWLWYEVARRLGRDRLKGWARRHGRWITMGPEDIDRADDWFRRHGWTVVLFGRLVPGLRTLVSIPAGIARMPRRRFLMLSAAGTLAWNGVLVGCGALLGTSYRAVEGWIGPVANAVLVGAVLLYLYRLVTFRPS